MDSQLNEEQQAIKRMARDFANAEIAPRAADCDETREFPWDNVRKMADLGFLGIFIPERYGGAGSDHVSYALALEEVSRACASTGVIMSVNNSLVCWGIHHYGSEAQKQKYLVPLAQGKKLGCFALTEPGAGSDAANIQTTAVLQGDEYVLNGTKIFITNGGVADVIIVMAVTEKEKRHRGMSTFIVEKDFPGFRVGKREKTLGLRASSTSELIFEDCRVPKENLVAQEGFGFRYAMETLDGGRIGIGAQALGIAQACLDASIAFAKDRQQFGRPIAEFQAIQWMLADMATQIAAARWLVLCAADLKDKKLPYATESSMAKLFASETAMRSATKAVQIHGGYGYVSEYPVERYFRDAKITEIYEGTNEIQRLIISSSILKEG